MPVLSSPLVLGIETSCDETAAAVVRADGSLLSDVVHTQVAVHAPYGGVVPELASRDHLVNIDRVVESALQRAGVGLAQLDGIAVTHRPGLVGALLVGVQYGKALAFAAGKPMVGVDHLVGHLLSVFVRRDAADPIPPAFPFVALLVSGGHTALYRVDGPRLEQVRELGATRDDAAGEAFDKVAKLLGLGYPGGPQIDRLAKLGDAQRFTLPRSLPRSLEMSFSGVKTQVARLVERGAVQLAQEQDVRDMAASFQHTVVETLVQKLFAAAEEEQVRSVVIGGGVAANGALRRRVAEEASRRGMQGHVPAIAGCTDNAAMIAYAGAVKLQHEGADPWNLGALPTTSLPRATRKGRGPRA